MPFIQTGQTFNGNSSQRNYSFGTIQGNNWSGVKINGQTIPNDYKPNGKFLVKIEWEGEDPTHIYCDKDLKVEITGRCEHVDLSNTKLDVTGDVGTATTSNASINIGGDCKGNCSTSNATIRVEGSVSGNCKTSNGNIYKNGKKQ